MFIYVLIPAVGIIMFGWIINAAFWAFAAVFTGIRLKIPL
jgi:hypothetical protein